jgi:hypothetical protein
METLREKVIIKMIYLTVFIESILRAEIYL